MSNQDQNQTHENTGANSNSTVNPGNGEADDGIHGTNNNSHTRRHSRATPPIHKRIIAFVKKDKKQPVVANIVSFFMLLVTAFLALYTYKVFRQTTRQTEIADSSAKASKISADAAKLSADLQKRALDSQIAAKRESDAADKRKEDRDIATFKIQDSSYRSQIKALKETQDEFEIENRPFLSATSISIDTTDKADVKVNFLLVNTGKRPLIIRESHHQVSFSTYKTLPQPINYQFNGSFVNNVLSNQEFQHVLGFGSPKGILEFLKNGTYSTYIFGYFIYQAVNSKKEYFIRFTYKVSLFPQFNVEAIRFEYN